MAEFISSIMYSENAENSFLYNVSKKGSIVFLRNNFVKYIK